MGRSRPGAFFKALGRAGSLLVGDIIVDGVDVVDVVVVVDVDVVAELSTMEGLSVKTHSLRPA